PQFRLRKLPHHSLGKAAPQNGGTRPKIQGQAARKTSNSAVAVYSKPEIELRQSPESRHGSYPQKCSSPCCEQLWRGLKGSGFSAIPTGNKTKVTFLKKSLVPTTGSGSVANVPLWEGVLWPRPGAK